MKKLVLYRYSARNSSFNVYFFTDGSAVFFFLIYGGKSVCRFSMPNKLLLGMIDFPHLLSLFAYGCFSAIHSSASSFVDLDVSLLEDAIISKYGIKKVESFKFI